MATQIQMFDTNVVVQFTEVSGFSPQSTGKGFRICVDINTRLVAETPTAQCDATGRLVWLTPAASTVDIAMCPLPSGPSATQRTTMVIRVMEDSLAPVASMALDLMYQGDKKKRATLDLPGSQRIQMIIVIQQQMVKPKAPVGGAAAAPPLQLPPPPVNSHHLRQGGMQVCDRIHEGTMRCDILKKESLLLHTACVTLQQDFDVYSSEVEEAQGRIAKLRADLERSRTAAQEMRQLRVEVDSMRQDANAKARSCACVVM